MDQHSYNQNEFLRTVLANPANEPYLYADNLQQLVNKYPQSGILQALLINSQLEKNLKRGAVYFKPELLYKLLHAPATYKEVSREQIMIDDNIIFNSPIEIEPSAELILHDVEPQINTDFNNDTSIQIEEETAKINLPAASVQQANLDVEDIDVHYLPQTEAEIEEYIHADDIALEERVLHEEPENVVVPEIPVEEQEIELIANDQNIENAGETIIENKIQTDSTTSNNQEITTNTTPELIEAGEEKPPHLNLGSETDKLIVGSIASTDFFMFEKAFGEPKHEPIAENTLKDTEEKTDLPVSADAALLTNDTESQDLSKYHDDKMPYTFMWWLDKTRKEHQGIYQPFVEPDKSFVASTNDTNNKLEQQYFENIFHITPIDELEKNNPTQTIEFSMKRKENKIIERFITQEPQIKPQSSDKLDTENKARKSSEDRDEEIVTETLAAIYTDQMLYHKAIASYKKLMLKFPEKSVYFADKIKQLEKKTN